MKRICTLLLALMLIFVFTSTIYGETMEKVKVSKVPIEDLVDELTEDTTITLSAYSRLHAIDVSYNLNKEKLEHQKKAMRTFLERLGELHAGQETDMMIINPENPAYDYGASIRIQTPSQSPRQFALRDNLWISWDGLYEIDNPQDMIDYMVSAVWNELTVLGSPLKISQPQLRRTGINLETKTWDFYDGKTKTTSRASFLYVEKLQFDVLVDDSYYDTVIEQISDAGKEIQCTIEQISDGTAIYILTLEGNKGKKQFVQEEYSESFSGSTTGNALGFALNHIFDGTNVKLYDTDEIKPDRIVFKGETANGGISKISMLFQLHPGGKQPNKLLASNIRYEYYSTEELFKTYSRNLVARFGIQAKDIEIKKPTGNDVQPQDPERYATDLRGVYKDGATVIDFYIDFMAKTKLPTLSGNKPKWLSALGDNVEFSIISMVQTLNGKPRMSYPMIRLKGTRGIQWFDVATVEAAVSPGEMTSHVKDDYTVYLSFNSLLSFEGFTTIKNSVSYDTFSMFMKFADTKKTELKSIEMNLGNQLMTIDVEDINYTGGGKGTYENWW